MRYVEVGILFRRKSVNIGIISAACFVCADYDEEDEARECFEPLTEKDFAEMIATERTAQYDTLAPKQAPEFVMLPVGDGIDMLRMYTFGLHYLHTPEEMCIRKALELIENTTQYEVALSVFRHDLTQQFLDVNDSYEEVDSLINGIGALCEYLRDFFKMHGVYKGERLAYVFDSFIPTRKTLVLRKFSYFNGNSITRQEPVVGRDYSVFPKTATALH